MKKTFMYIKNKLFTQITYGVWLTKDSYIAGWKIKVGDINHLHSNTNNYYPYTYDSVIFKKKVKYVLNKPYFINKAFSNVSWYKQWKLDSKFKGFKPY